MKGSSKILSKAISGLRSKKAPDLCWEKILAQLDDQVLQEAVDNMEVKQAPEDSWDQIQSALDESPLTRAIADIPQRKLVDDNFDQLLEPKIDSKNRFGKWLGIAASVLVIFSLYWLYLQPAESLQYSEEIVSESLRLPHVPTEFEKDEVLMFIRENCAIDQVRCKSSEFAGLYDLYLELSEAQKELKTELEKNQQMSALVSYLVETEKEKTEVGKQLIYLIMS